TLNVKAFYDKKPHKENKTCTPPTPIPEDACCSEGGNGRSYEWAVSLNYKLIDNVTDPETCCRACYKDPECFSWQFQPDCYIYFNATEDCLYPSYNTANDSQGTIRCGFCKA
ncbi:3287_t:CDS:1, partial [Dentiscutata heterogama]